MASETYEFLQEILKTGEVNRWLYPDYINNVISARNPSSTRIIIEFTGDEFLETLGIENSDDKYTWNKFSGTYNYDYDIDYDRYRDDWKEGYIIDYLSEKNKEKVISILEFVSPELSVNLNLEDQDSKIKVSELFENKFEETSDIINYYGIELENCIGRAVKEILINETKNPYLRFGIIEKYHGWKFETSVGILLNWYKQLKVEDFDIKQLLTTLIMKYQPNVDRGDWYDLEYSVGCDDFDSETFNYDVEKILDSLIDTLEESMVENENYGEYLKIIAVVSNLGGFDRWIDIEKENRRIKFLSINPKTSLLIFNITKKGGSYSSETRSVNTLDDLNTTLNHPELFEHLKKTIKKIL